ncbi:MAG: hypothetical protein WBF17_01680 [Phycisphaerae bacterium]
MVRSIRISVIAASVVAAAVAIPPAMAGPDYDFAYEIDDARIEYGGVGAQTLVVNETEYSDFNFRLMHGGVVEDAVEIEDGHFELLADLIIEQVAGKWTAKGTFSFSDKDIANGDVALGDFQSAYIKVENNHDLVIFGNLSVSGSNQYVLVGPDDPWKFDGEKSGAGGDGDSVVTLPVSKAGFTGGTLWVIRTTMGTGTYSVDDIFGGKLDDDPGNSTDGEWSRIAGEVKGSIVPVPAAVVLGLVGLGIVGIRMRKHA